MLTHPRCGACGHSKTKHTTRKQYWRLKSHNAKDSPFCVDCYTFFQEGAQYERDLEKDINKVNMWHAYYPENNLEYLERKYEKFEKVNRSI